jgi:hypothetical protein
MHQTSSSGCLQNPDTQPECLSCHPWEHPQGELLSLVHFRSLPVDGLSDSGLDRLFPLPGDDEQPDAPREGKEKGKVA